MATNWKKMVAEAKPLNLGFPFGAYKARILCFEEARREGGGGTKKNYIDWHMQIIEFLDPSALGKINSIHNIALMVDLAMNESRHVAFAAAAHGSDFETFQNLDGDKIQEFMELLMDEKAMAKAPIYVDLIVSHQASDPAYREFMFYPVGTSPKDQHVYIPVEVTKKSSTQNTADKARGTAKASEPTA